jgi:hypothetical protein
VTSAPRFDVVRTWLPGRLFLFRATIRDKLSGTRIDVSSRSEAELIAGLLNEAEQGVVPPAPREVPELSHYVVGWSGWVLRVRSSTYSSPVVRAPTRELAERIADLLNRVDPEERSRDASVAWSRLFGSVQYLWEPLRRRP